VVTESVNLKDPELEEAATVIQARYRGYATRKHRKEEEEANNKEKDDEKQDEPRLKEEGEEKDQEPIVKADEEEEKKIDMANQEEEVDIDLNDPGVGNAAVKIQASFRGHQVRRQQEKDKAKADADAELAEKMQKAKVEEEEELPDLNDPEIHKAATKIQAQFKGHMVRKKKEDDASK